MWARKWMLHTNWNEIIRGKFVPCTQAKLLFFLCFLGVHIHTNLWYGQPCHSLRAGHLKSNINLSLMSAHTTLMRLLVFLGDTTLGCSIDKPWMCICTDVSLYSELLEVRCIFIQKDLWSKAGLVSFGLLTLEAALRQGVLKDDVGCSQGSRKPSPTQLWLFLQTDLEGALGERVLKDVSVVVGALGGHPQ